MLFTGSVGSSWFHSLICAHPKINQLGFEPLDEFARRGLDPAPPLETLCRGGDISALARVEGETLRRLRDGTLASFDPSAPILSLKARPNIHDASDFWTETVPHNDAFIVLMRRRNKLKNAISEYKRRVLNVTHLSDFEKTEFKRRPVRIDTGDILARTWGLITRELAAAKLFEVLTEQVGLDAIEYCYEDLRGPGAGETAAAGLHVRLGLEPVPTKSVYRKITSDNIADAVENFDALREAVSGTLLERHLEGDEFDPVREIREGTLIPEKLEPEERYREIERAFALA